MIITSIKAENVLKYQSLNLNDLPEKGVIAISGKNESGKSTIGETVCFALFGRTFSLDADDLYKIVYWGASGCSVSLSFRIGDDNHYVIERFLDKDGTHSAKFSRLGEEDLPIARGVDGVADALFVVLGYEYEGFVDSFYLAQREITAPQPNSHTVKAMAGIASLEYVNAQFDEEIAEFDDIATLSQFRIDEINAELNELAINPDHLGGLESELERVNAAEVENLEKVESLNLNCSNYSETYPDIIALRSSLSKSSVFRLFVFFLGIITATIWGSLTQIPEAGFSQMLQNLVTIKFPQFNDEHLEQLKYLASGLGILLIIVQLRMLSMESKLNELMKNAYTLADALKNSQESMVVVGDSLLESDEDDEPELQLHDSSSDNFSELIQELEQQQNEINIDAEICETDVCGQRRPTEAEIGYTCERVNNANMPGSEVENVVEREINWLREEIERLQLQASALDRAIYHEQQRLKHADHLNEENDSLLERLDEMNKKVATRQLANELLADANLHLSTQFNNDVRDLVSRTLPLFTEGRYEHLQIAQNMEVSVFSGEKRDFLNLEEVSSGTQRQIMLALRLALSQELVNRSVEGEQFQFLDEPFAFFDEARTKSSLKVLPNLSDEINQIFVVAQNFPEESLGDFAVHFECFREIESLTYP